MTLEDPFSKAPSLKRLQGFSIWLVRNKTGRMEQRLASSTVETNWQMLERLIHDRCGHRYRRNERDEIRRWIKVGLVEHEGVSLRARPKPLANQPVVVDVLYFLWALDEREYDHPRVRLQLSLSLLLMLYTGIRPGEFVESFHYKGSNEGVLYKDLKIAYLYTMKGDRRYSCRVTFRNRKGRRGEEDKAFTMTLNEDRDSPGRCPILQILGLAIADGALEGVNCVEDLAKLQPSAGRMLHEVHIRQSMRDTPLFRATTYVNGPVGISPTSIWSYGGLSKALRQLGERAGYKDTFNTYNIRRGHGFVSAVQRRKQIGQKSDYVFLSYIFQTSGVDSQAILNGQEPEQLLMDFMQSMLVNLDVAAPRPRGSQLTGIGRKGLPRVRSPADVMCEPGTVTSDHKGAADGREQSPSEPRCYPDQIVRPPASLYFRKYLLSDPARLRVIKSLYEPNANSSFGSSVTFLSTIADPGPSVWRYPQAEPNEQNRCQPCGKTMTEPNSSLKVARSRNIEDNLHLLKCRLLAMHREAERTLMQGVRERLPRCRWALCLQPFDKFDRRSTPGYVSRHLPKTRRNCLWSTCRQIFDSAEGLRDHLTASHDVPSIDSSSVAPAYCHDCQEYFVKSAEWSNHHPRQPLHFLSGR